VKRHHEYKALEEQLAENARVAAERSKNRKPRCEWTDELEGEFLEAVKRLGGFDNANAKTIHDVSGWCSFEVACTGG